MKDSGIPWLGQIPELWAVSPIGRVFREVNSLNSDLQEDNALQFKMGEIVSKKEGNSKYNPETLEAYNVVEPGTIMINGLNLSFDFISQRVALVKEKGVITSTYLAIFPCSHVKSDFAKFLLKAYDNCKALHAMGRGLRATLSYSTFRSEFFLLPPLPEQERIAEYLDRKCAEIDELISVEEQMIVELQAYKQSVITETVTRGLNPAAPLKDSGIPWLGQIPEQWALPKISKISEIITDYVASGSFADLAENVKYLDEPDYAMLVRTVDVSGKGQSGKYVYVNKEAYEFLSNSNLYGGEIMLPNVGAVGDVYMIPNLYKHMTLAPNSIMVRTTQCDKYYYYYFFSESGRLSLINLSQSTAQPKFNKTVFRRLKVLLPPLPEQKAIAEYLDRKCEEIDALVEVKQRKIEELKEYKKSVIYEYVTGKKEIV